jgi:TM2 domain-containing membrane protein YozV
LAQLPPIFHRIYRYAMLFAILLPGISMIFRGHILKGLLCGILHVTVIGWIPAAIWAVASYREDLAEKRHQETLKVLTRQGRTY